MNLVQVDSIVTDGKANRISGLQTEDVVVTEDGKRQTITNCEWIDFHDEQAAFGAQGPTNPPVDRPND